MYTPSVFHLLVALVALPFTLGQSSVATVGTCAYVPLFAQLDATYSGVAQGTIRSALGAGDAALGGSICLCEQAGALNANSLATINSDVNANVGAQASTVAAIETATGLNSNQLITLLDSTSLATLNNNPQNCAYPAFSNPTCGTGCSFTCQTGYTECTSSTGTVTCATSCPSGAMSKRRLLAARVPTCPGGSEACPLPFQASSIINGNERYECVNLKSDIEQCGGCMFPLKLGQAIGVDCTALTPFANEVSCRSGVCYIDSCVSGYVVNGTECVKVLKARDGGFRVQAGLARH